MATIQSAFTGLVTPTFSGTSTFTGPVVAQSTIAATGQISVGGINLPALQAATAAGGFALQNATPTLITFTTPNDGAKHFVTIVSWLNIAVTETGGAVAFNYTAPDGSVQAPNMYPGGGAGPGTGVFALQRMVNPNTVVSVTQTSALTAGTATVYAQIWAE